MRSSEHRAHARWVERSGKMTAQVNSSIERRCVRHADGEDRCWPMDDARRFPQQLQTAEEIIKQLPP